MCLCCRVNREIIGMSIGLMVSVRFLHTYSCIIGGFHTDTPSTRQATHYTLVGATTSADAVAAAAAAIVVVAISVEITVSSQPYSKCHTHTNYCAVGVES